MITKIQIQLENQMITTLYTCIQLLLFPKIVVGYNRGVRQFGNVQDERIRIARQYATVEIFARRYNDAALLLHALQHLIVRRIDFLQPTRIYLSMVN